MIHSACYCSRTETAHFIRSSDVFGSNTLLNRSRELSVFLSPPVSVFIFPFTLFSPLFLQLLASQTCQTGSAAVGRGKQIPVKTSERGKIRSAPHNVTSDPSTAWLAMWAGELEAEQKRKPHGARWGHAGKSPHSGSVYTKAPLPCTPTAQNKSIFMSCCHHIGQSTHLWLDVPDSAFAAGLVNGNGPLAERSMNDKSDMRSLIFTCDINTVIYGHEGKCNGGTQWESRLEAHRSVMKWLLRWVLASSLL